MTIEQAWLIVLEHYHDALPPPWQWRPGQKKCKGGVCEYAYEVDHGIGMTLPTGNRIACEHGRFKPHDIPAPALTDAAAMAVLRALPRIDLDLQRYDGLDGKIKYVLIHHNGFSVHPTCDDPRDAIILAAAELAQKERAK